MNLFRTAHHRLKTAVKHRLFGPPGDRMRTIHHGLLKGMNCAIDTSVKTLQLTGMYEREIASVLREWSAEATTALDIGANDGWYALYFSSISSIRQVYAFEPEPRLLESFRRNLDANNAEFKAKVTIVPKLVGATPRDGWCTVDSFASEQIASGLGDRPIFKIDVEGGELDVLHGARQTLQDSRAMLVVECHSPELERDCISFLAEIGYQSRIIRPAWYRLFVPHGRPVPFNQWFVARRG